MRKHIRRIGICLLLAGFVWCGTLMTHAKTLRNELIRLHVVGASDSEHDQSLKLQVRDAIVGSLEKELQNLTDPECAKAYLAQNLEKMEKLANRVLAAAGSSDKVTVTLQKEPFPTRDYDTFSLPAGVYETLQVCIGPAEGRNWWCVVFPGLCMGATTEEFENIAACSGLSGELTRILEEKDGYEIRFYLLELFGKVENLLYGA